MTTSFTRRRLLQMGGAAAGVAAAGVFGKAPRAAAADLAAAPREAQTGAAKRVALFNLHTGEQLDVEFFRGGYVPDSLAAIQVLLRDFRTGERHAIDPHLIATIHDVARSINADPVFSVISGYRSPQTNAQLRARSSGVAAHSLHIEGRAIDVRLAGVDCRALATAAESLARGGVGYYRASNFVHLDTGGLRTWRGKDR